MSDEPLNIPPPGFISEPLPDPGPDHVLWHGKVGDIIPDSAEFWIKDDKWMQSGFCGAPLCEEDAAGCVYRVRKPTTTEP